MDKIPDYSSRRFLLVDDETFMLGMIDRILKQCNPGAITKVTDGGMALRSIKDNFTQVDCIISDFNMKPINGLQLLQAVRAGVNPKIPREQPFIMLTGHGETEVVKTAISLDVHGYVVKPVASDKLFQTIDRVLKKPLEVKDADYYRSIKLPQFQDSTGTGARPPASGWTVLSPTRPIKHADSVKQKLEQFAREHATTDGVDSVKIRNRRECPVAELFEGQILAQDIHAEEGKVLLRQGTHLTKGMITRLKEISAETNPSQSVWVGELA